MTAHSTLGASASACLFQQPGQSTWPLHPPQFPNRAWHWPSLFHCSSCDPHRSPLPVPPSLSCSVSPGGNPITSSAPSSYRSPYGSYSNSQAGAAYHCCHFAHSVCVCVCVLCLLVKLLCVCVCVSSACWWNSCVCVSPLLVGETRVCVCVCVCVCPLLAGGTPDAHA